jgi:hypothetical protein
MNSVQVSPLFPMTSRYYATGTNVLTVGSRQVPYLLRRFLPPTSDFTVIRVYTVVDGDRLDNISSATLGDPLAFWRICDANNAMLPEDLTATPGRKIGIALPQGMQGVTGG